MKLDRHGIRFTIWLSFFLFAVMIVGLLGILQMALIQPYYRDSKIRSVQEVSDVLAGSLLLKTADEKDIAKALQVSVNNNVCATIYNEQDHLIYETDSLGNGCVFHVPSEVYGNSEMNVRDPQKLRELLSGDAPVYSLTLTNTRTQQEMILYGQRVRGTLGTYYVYVNSPLEPVDSIIQFFSRQYILYMVVMVLFASVISVLISMRLTRPIRNMKTEADKLAAADYHVHFDGGAYTETKDLASTLNDAARKLSRIDELRKDLIANVSHDIKTPLTSIRAYAEMIQDVSGEQADKRRQHLNVIIREADYMNQLVNDMSELAKLQSGNYILHKSRFDLMEKLQDICTYNAMQIKEGELNVQPEGPKEMFVYADEVKIMRVINNFLTNAIKHTPPHGSITISVRPADAQDTVRVEVKDEGEGIREEDLPFIWDRYQKSSKSFSRSLSSTGLGLSIARGILDAHHAQYGVSSEYGKGSTFWFILKCLPEAGEDHHD